MRKEKTDTTIQDNELKKLTSIYKQLSEPDRSIFIMGGNLLLASQNAKQKVTRAHETG